MNTGSTIHSHDDDPVEYSDLLNTLDMNNALVCNLTSVWSI